MYHPFKIFRAYQQMTEGCASRREGGFSVSHAVRTAFARCPWRTGVNECSSSRPDSRPLATRSAQLCSPVRTEQRSEGWLVPVRLRAVVPASLANVRVLFHPGLQPYLDGLGNDLCWLVPAQVQHRSWLIPAKTSPLVVAVCWPASLSACCLAVSVHSRGDLEEKEAPSP